MNSKKTSKMALAVSRRRMVKMSGKNGKSIAGTIRVVVCRTGIRSETIEVANTLAALQEIVGGYVERIALPDGCHLWINEEGRVDGLPQNRMCPVPVFGMDLRGDIVVSRGNADGDEIGLTAKEAQKWAKIMDEKMIRDDQGGQAGAAVAGPAGLR